MPDASGRTHPGPPRQYERIEPVVRAIWLAVEQPCGKRLARHCRCGCRIISLRHGKLSSRHRELLREVGPAPLYRLLAPGRADRTLVARHRSLEQLLLFLRREWQ